MCPDRRPRDDTAAISDAVALTPLQDLREMYYVASLVARAAGLPVAQILALPLRDAFALLDRLAAERDVQRAIDQLHAREPP
jgi:hypothetical protein